MSRTYRKDVRKYGWKHWGVPKWFRQLNRQEERAKQNQALRECKELPHFRKRDAYEYW